MGRRFEIGCWGVAISVVLSGAAPAYAEWPTNGTPIIVAPCEETPTAAVADVMTLTGRPPQKPDSAASNFCTHGTLVIQPERSTSPTPVMVASSSTGPANLR